MRQRYLQRMRQAVAGSRLERMLRRLGLGKFLLARYERAVLRDGKHAVVANGQRLTFGVHDRSEITRIDMFMRNEGELMRRILGSIQPNDIMFDVGANIGMVSVLVAASARELGVTVHAFEPHPETAQRAERNAVLNRCANITVHNVALGNESGTAKLYAAIGASRGTDSMISVGESATEPLDVQVARGDDFLDRLNVSPTVVKIDVEGAEMDVLLGMEELIGRGSVRELFVEIHPDLMTVAGHDESELVRWLEARGFRQLWQERRGGQFHCHLRREES